MRLRTQFSLAFIPILLLSGAGLVVLSQRAVHRVIQDTVADRGKAMLKSLATGAALAFETHSEGVLLARLTAAMNQEGAIYAIALDKQGRVLAHTNVVEKGKHYHDALSVAAVASLEPLVQVTQQGKREILDISWPVRGLERRPAENEEEMFFSQKRTIGQEVRVGTLRLGMSLENSAAIERNILSQLVLLVLCAGAVLLGLALLLVRGILTPVDHLVKATDQIASGVYGVSLPIPAARELADLARRFNRMNHTLAQATVSKDFLDSILFNMQEPLIVLRPDFRIRLANRAALSILDYPEEELIGRRADRFWGALKTLLKKIVHQGPVKDQELQFRTRAGLPIVVLLSGSAFRDKEGKLLGIILVARDIRERKKLEKEMAHADKLSAVGRLASGVAHEVNNPLGVILGFAQAMLFDLKPGHESEFPLKSIEREALRCKNLVQDLLTFSRVSKTEREPMEINKAVLGALSLVEAQAKLGRVKVVKELADDLPRILGNINQIQQIVINLANNALDAMKQEGKLTVRTEHLSDGPRPWVVLSVIDTGPGIPDDVLPRIFEPFFTTKPVGQGTGLGLGLVHEIIQKHSATIEVETRPGHTEFRVKFPAAGQPIPKRPLGPV